LLIYFFSLFEQLNRMLSVVWHCWLWCIWP